MDPPLSPTYPRVSTQHTVRWMESVCTPQWGGMLDPPPTPGGGEPPAHGGASGAGISPEPTYPRVSGFGGGGTGCEFQHTVRSRGGGVLDPPPRSPLTPEGGEPPVAGGAPGAISWSTPARMASMASRLRISCVSPGAKGGKGVQVVTQRGQGGRKGVIRYCPARRGEREHWLWCLDGHGRGDQISYKPPPLAPPPRVGGVPAEPYRNSRALPTQWSALTASAASVYH